VENPERKCRIKSTQYFTLEENKKKKEGPRWQQNPDQAQTPWTSKCRHGGRRVRARV
jgi:hypothetical protein